MTQIDLIQIEVKDLLLGERVLDPVGQDHFADLSAKVSLRRKQEGFCDLLGDGAATLDNASRAEVGNARANHAGEVDPAMLEELVVFRRNKGAHDDFGDLLIGNDIAAFLEELSERRVFLGIGGIGRAHDPGYPQRTVILNRDDLRKAVRKVPKNHARADHARSVHPVPIKNRVFSTQVASRFRVMGSPFAAQSLVAFQQGGGSQPSDR